MVASITWTPSPGNTLKKGTHTIHTWWIFEYLRPETCWHITDKRFSFIHLLCYQIHNSWHTKLPEGTANRRKAQQTSPNHMDAHLIKLHQMRMWQKSRPVCGVWGDLWGERRREMLQNEGPMVKTGGDFVDLIRWKVVEKMPTTGVNQLTQGLLPIIANPA